MAETGTVPAINGRLSGMRLYVVTDATQPPERVLETVRAAGQGGADAIQLRRKGGDDLENLRLAERCRQACADAGVLFVVDDRLDIAMAVGADGVHLGQDDLPIAVVRRLWPGGLVGRSTHSFDQAMTAVAEGADYLGVGPVYATPTKPGRPAVGLELIRAVARARVAVPWVAIGGIAADNVQAVLDAGASAVAVVRAVCTARDPAAATRVLRRRVAGHLEVGAA
jgi:thiamine-phosphate pyrophosphorylase